MLVARDGNDPSFFGRKPNVLPLDERAKLRLSSSVLYISILIGLLYLVSIPFSREQHFWASGRDWTDSIPGYKSGAPPFMRQKQLKN